MTCYSTVLPGTGPSAVWMTTPLALQCRKKVAGSAQTHAASRLQSSRAPEVRVTPAWRHTQDLTPRVPASFEGSTKGCKIVGMCPS